MASNTSSASSSATRTTWLVAVWTAVSKASGSSSRGSATWAFTRPDALPKKKAYASSGSSSTTAPFCPIPAWRPLRSPSTAPARAASEGSRRALRRRRRVRPRGGLRHSRSCRNREPDHRGQRPAHPRAPDRRGRQRPRDACGRAAAAGARQGHPPGPSRQRRRRDRQLLRMGLQRLAHAIRAPVASARRPSREAHYRHDRDGVRSDGSGRTQGAVAARHGRARPGPIRP